MIRNLLNSTWNQRPVILLIYAVQFLFAISLGIQIWHVMEASIGDSLSMNTIQEGFNRTVFEDFLQVHGASISPLIGILRWVVPVYLIFAVLFHTGLIYNLTKNKKTIRSWIKGGAIYYSKSLIITLMSFGIMLVLTALIWLPFFIIIGNPVEFFDNEKGFIFWLVSLFIINMAVLGFVWWWTFALRFILINDDLNKIPWKKGTQLFIKGMLGYLKLTLLFLFLNALVYLMYTFLTHQLSANNIWLIIMMFLLQQVFNIARVGLRVGFYKGLIDLKLKP